MLLDACGQAQRAHDIWIRARQCAELADTDARQCA